MWKQNMVQELHHHGAQTSWPDPRDTAIASPVGPPCSVNSGPFGREGERCGSARPGRAPLQAEEVEVACEVVVRQAGASGPLLDVCPGRPKWQAVWTTGCRAET